LEILKTRKRPKEKFKEILSIGNKIICHMLLIGVLKALHMAIDEIIEFERKLNMIDKNLIILRNKEYRKARYKWTIRRRFYFYLGLTLFILLYKRFGLGFSFGSKNSLIDSEDQTKVDENE